MGKKCGKFKFFFWKSKKSSKSLDNISIYLDKILIYLDKISITFDKISITFKYLEYLDLSRKSRFVSTISIKISTHLNLDWKVSILKILTEIKKIDLNMKDNLDGFQKLVSTRWTFSISISIGLDCRDPQP